MELETVWMAIKLMGSNISPRIGIILLIGIFGKIDGILDF
jgi:hypothetical protein